MSNPPPNLVDAQPGFNASLAPNYLGNPTLVSGLVAAFCADVMGLVESHGPEFKRESRDLVMQLADVFAGRNPEFITIKGYNETSLKGKLMADLGDFWRVQRSDWNDDPAAVLFWLLFVQLVEALKRADGDEVLFGVIMRPHIQGVVQRLLGIERRVH